MTAIDKQVAVSNRDGMRYLATSFTSNSHALTVGYEGGDWSIFMGFVGLSGLSGKTAENSYLTLHLWTSAGTTPTLKIYAIDNADAVANALPTSYTAFDALTLTTAAIDWDANYTTYPRTWNNTSDISGIINELITSYGDSLASIVFVIKNDGMSTQKTQSIDSYDEETNVLGPKLHFEYPSGGWATIGKVNGVASASISKYNGVAVASISKFNGQVV